MVLATFFILIQNPKSNTDIGSNKQLPWKNNNSLHFVILNQFFSNFQSITVIQCSIRKKKAGNTVRWL